METLLEALRDAMHRVPERRWPKTVNEEGEVENVVLENFDLQAIIVCAGGDWQKPAFMVFNEDEAGQLVLSYAASPV